MQPICRKQRPHLKKKTAKSSFTWKRTLRKIKKKNQYRIITTIELKILMKLNFLHIYKKECKTTFYFSWTVKDAFYIF
jgi:hypothetical protein